MPLTLVKDLMTDVVETLQIGDTLAWAEELMKTGRFRHLPVVDGSERLVGLVTHRAVQAAWVSHGHPNDETHARLAAEIPIETLMESNVLTVTPDTTALAAAALLARTQFGCLPVVEREKLVGIVTEADFVKYARRQFEAEVP